MAINDAIFVDSYEYEADTYFYFWIIMGIYCFFTGTPHHAHHTRYALTAS